MIQPDVTVERLNEGSLCNLAEHLGMEFTDVGKNYLCAKMPVDHRTMQPMGLLHGGASVALAETLGSVGAYCCIDRTKQYCVGLEINANHLRSVKGGYVYGKAVPIHIGKSTHVWSIEIRDDAERLVCISRITMAVLDR